MLGHLGTQRGGDVVAKELPHLGQPRPLLIVELELHNRDISRSSYFATRSCERRSEGARDVTYAYMCINLEPGLGRHQERGGNDV